MHFIEKELVIEVCCRRVVTAERRVFHDVFTPFFESVHAKDDLIGDRFFKISVFNAVARISEGNTTGIGAKLLDGLAKGEEVARRLGHFLTVQEKVAVGADRARPMFGRKEDKVDIEEEGQMIGDQIFARRIHVERVPIREFVFHHIEIGFRDLRGGENVFVKGFAAKDIVPHFIGHLARFDWE